MKTERVMIMARARFLAPGTLLSSACTGGLSLFWWAAKTALFGIVCAAMVWPGAARSLPRPSTPAPTSAVVARYAGRGQPTPSNATMAFVARVIDGDTVEVFLGDRRYTVRYIGVDAPETVHPNRPVEPFGPEAAAANRALVANKWVVLEKDITEIDRYGRLLRYVWVGDTLVNAELVRLGLAQVSTYPPDVKYVDLFLAMEHEAQTAGRGIWGDTAAVSPTAFPLATPTPYVVAEDGNVNLRSGPGQTYPALGYLRRGDGAPITGRYAYGQWWQVCCVDRNRVWVAAWVVAPYNDTSAVPLIFTVSPTPTVAWRPMATPTLLSRPMPSPTGPVCNCSYDRYNCSDFAARRDAQSCYTYCLRVAGYDVHRLDADRDGLACERNSP